MRAGYLSASARGLPVCGGCAGGRGPVEADEYADGGCLSAAGDVRDARRGDRFVWDASNAVIGQNRALEFFVGLLRGDRKAYPRG